MVDELWQICIVMNNIYDYIIISSKHVEEIYSKKLKYIMDNWRKKYHSTFYATCKLKHYSCYWHIFAKETAKSYRLDKADRMFVKANKEHVYVVSTNVKLPFLVCDNLNINNEKAVIDLKKSLFCNMAYADIYIFDENYKWTYVITHDEYDGVGPYYAEAADYSAQ